MKIFVNNRISIQFTQVTDIARDGDGSFLNIDKTGFSLFVFYCQFSNCHVNQATSNGGCICYLSTNGNIQLERIVANNCSAYEGHFFFGNDASYTTSACFQLVSTFNTYGTSRGTILFYHIGFTANFYNSSHCSTQIHCNFHSLSCTSLCKAQYFNFFDCYSDILYGIDCDSTSNEGYIDYANIVYNKPSQHESQYGLLYTLSHKDYTLFCSNLCFYGNEWTLLANIGGNIYIYDSQYDTLSTYGKIDIVTCSEGATFPNLYEFVIFNKIYFSYFSESKQKMLLSPLCFTLFSYCYNTVYQ